MKKVVCFLILLCAAFTYGADALKPAGKAVKLAPLQEYTVLLPAKPAEQDLFASEQLVKYLKEMTGVALTVKNEPFNRKGNVISIGETALAKKNNIPQVTAQTYRLDCRGKDLFIKGSAYGVIAFLEEDLGIRWYRKDESPYIPKKSASDLTVVPREYTPVFDMREPIFDEAWHHTEWGAFNRLQPYSYFFNIPAKMGGGISNSKFFIHTYDEVIPAKKYYDKHPDIFPLINGKRHRSTQYDGQLCYTNPKVADIFTEELEKAIQERPGSRLFSVSQNDNNNSFCECETCKKLIAEDGLSGAAIRLANNVAERLAKKYPDIRISTLSYNETQNIPTVTRPSDNTVIFYAPIRQRAMALQYLPWEDVEIIMNQVNAWTKFTKHFHVWDYVNTPRIVPFPNFDVVDRNFALWAKCGVKGVLLESAEYNMNSLGALKSWVFTKKLWNPAWNMDLLIEEFIDGTYGKSAPEMKEYVAIQRNCWKRFYANRRPGDSIKFTDTEIKRMQELLENAYKKTPNAKIASELCCFYAMGLTVCTTKNVAQYEKALTRVKELLKKHNLVYNTNKKRNEAILSDWESQLADVKKGNNIPLYCEDSVILKDRDLPGNVIKFVEDKGAYSGKAARQVRKTDWRVQWNFKKLVAAVPKPSVYVARFRLKPELKKVYSPEDNICSLHLWRAGIKGVQGRYIKYKELKSKDYQFIDVFKVYMFTNAVSGYFYNCTGNLEEGEAVLYDYIEFIPEDKFKDKELLKKLPQVTL